jgi:hypothetical protein
MGWLLVLGLKESQVECAIVCVKSEVILFYTRSEMILDHPNCLGRVQFFLVWSKSFWSCPNDFVQVQIRFFWTNFYNLDLSKMIWTHTKQIGPVQNDWYSTKMIWSVHFGSIEGQGICIMYDIRLVHVSFYDILGRYFGMILRYLVMKIYYDF